MLENRIMGNQTRYVRSDADSQNRQKCFFVKNYSAIFAIVLIAIAWMWNPSSAIAANDFACFSLVNNGNRITAVYGGVWNNSTTFANGNPITLAAARDYCHDSGFGFGLNNYYGSGNFAGGQNVLATRAVTLRQFGDHADYIQSWDMSQVADKIGCAASTGKVGFPGINQVVSMLPASPANMRIPTLLTKMAGENTLAGNLAIELYSGAWQFLGILTSFKLFKVFKG